MINDWWLLFSWNLGQTAVSLWFVPASQTNLKNNSQTSSSALKKEEVHARRTNAIGKVQPDTKLLMQSDVEGWKLIFTFKCVSSEKKIATRKFNMLCVPCLVCTLLVPSPLFYTEETPCCRCVPLFQCDCAVPTGHKTTLKGRDSCTVLSCCALCLQQILLDTVVHYGTVCSHAISCPLKDKNPFISLCKYLS